MLYAGVCILELNVVRRSPMGRLAQNAKPPNPAAAPVAITIRNRLLRFLLLTLEFAPSIESGIESDDGKLTSVPWIPSKPISECVDAIAS